MSENADYVAPHRRSVQTTPLMEALYAEVKRHRHRNLTFSEVLQWVLEDFFWCDEDKPAYGRWSPVMRGIFEDARAYIDGSCYGPLGRNHDD